jgi:hypothetical protein
MTDVSNQGTQGAAPTPVATPAPAVPVPAQAPTPVPAVPAAQAQPVLPVAPVVPPSVGDTPQVPNAPTVQSEAEEVVVYDATGDAGMDMALTFVGKLGLKPDHPAMVKASEGDFSFIKAHMATLGEKARGWEQHIALAEQAYASNVAKAEANTKSITSAVYSTAGGQEQWGQLEAWAKANADPKEKEYINRMLTDNPVSAAAAVLLLKQHYAKAQGTTVTPAPALKDGVPPAGGSAATVGPLSPKEYARAVSLLERAKPGSVDSGSPEYKQLQQRALAYKR